VPIALDWYLFVYTDSYYNLVPQVRVFFVQYNILSHNNHHGFLTVSSCSDTYGIRLLFARPTGLDMEGIISTLRHFEDATIGKIESWRCQPSSYERLHVWKRTNAAQLQEAFGS
jgi:hypothetical protein